MKKHLLLFLLALFTAVLPGMAAQDYDFKTTSSDMETATTKLSQTVTPNGDGVITVQFAKGTGSNDLNLKGTYIALQAGNTVAIEVTGPYVIKKVTFTCNSSYPLSSSKGYDKSGATIGTTGQNFWEGSKPYVLIKNTGSKQARISNIHVELTETGSSLKDPEMIWTDYQPYSSTGVYTHKATYTADLADGNANIYGYSNAMKNPPSNLTYASSNPEVAQVVEGYVTLYSAGTTTLTATYPGGTTYKAGSATCVLTVNGTQVVKPEITFSPEPGEWEYNTPVTCTVTNAEIATCDITCDDGTVNVTEVTENQKFTFNLTYDLIVTVDALSADGEEANKVVEYTVKRPAAPKFTPAGGEVAKGTKVTATSSTSKAYKYEYTILGENTDINETTPNEVTSFNFTVDEDIMVGAYAVLPNGYKSEEGSATYTIIIPKAPACPVFSEADGTSLDEGATVTLTAEGADKIYVAEYSITGHLKDFVEYTEPITVDRMHRRFVAYAENEVGRCAHEVEVFYGINNKPGKPGGAYYKLVTSTDQLKEGDKIIFVGTIDDGKTYSMSTTVYTNNRPASDAVTVTNNEITTLPDNVLILSLENSGDASYPWKFKTVNYGGIGSTQTQGYLNASGGTSNNRLTVLVNNTGATTVYAQITYSEGSNNPTVKFNVVNNGHGTMVVNQQLSKGTYNPIFNCYGSASNYKPVQIYKQYNIVGEPGEELTYAMTFHHVEAEAPSQKQNSAAMYAASETTTPKNTEMTVDNKGDGTFTANVDVNNLMGEFNFDIEGQSIAGENIDGNTVIINHHQHQENIDPTSEGYCSDEHAPYVHVEKGKEVKLIHADAGEGKALMMSTNGTDPDNKATHYHGSATHYATATATVALDPFRSATLTLTSNSTPTGVDNIVVDGEGNVEDVYYNLNGVRVDKANLVPGVYVRVNGTTASKVVVR